MRRYLIRRSRCTYFARCGTGNLLTDQSNLVVLQSFFIEPIWAGNFLEGVDGRLDSFGPSHGNELDVAMHVSHRKNSLPAGLEVRIDRDAAVVIQDQRQSFERLFRREETDLHD